MILNIKPSSSCTREGVCYLYNTISLGVKTLFLHILKWKDIERNHHFTKVMVPQLEGPHVNCTTRYNSSAPAPTDAVRRAGTPQHYKPLKNRNCDFYSSRSQYWLLKYLAWRMASGGPLMQTGSTEPGLGFLPALTPRYWGVANMSHWETMMAAMPRTQITIK